MADPGGPRVALSARLFLIVAAVVLLGSAIVLLDAGRSARYGEAVSVAVEPPIPGTPIAAEAGVFRTRPTDFAVDADAERRAAAHPRDLTMFRALRAYPGAPPRIPHGLTAREYRTTGCNACHRRGGYSIRFASYTPMTPHPEYSDCLQCHLPDARQVGIDFPGGGRDAHCRQCHAPESIGELPRSTLDWRPAAWPEVDQRALPEGPPLIPHDLQLRTNCVACHYGPAAVEEVRTPHGDRANCRQCHLPAAPGAGVYTRSTAVAAAGPGGPP